MESYVMQIAIILIGIVVCIFSYGVFKINKKMGIDDSWSMIAPWHGIYAKLKLHKVYSIMNDIIMFFLLVFLMFLFIELIILVFGIFVLVLGVIISLCTLFMVNSLLEFGMSIMQFDFTIISVLDYSHIIIPIGVVLLLLVNFYPFYKLCLAFGKSKLVSVILAIVSPVAVFVLGYDKSVYNEH